MPKRTSGTIHNEASEWDELEARSLVFAEMDGPQERLATVRTTSQAFRKRNIAVLLGLALCALMALKREDLYASLMLDAEAKKEMTMKDRVGHMINRVREANDAFHEILNEEYGEYKERIFNKDTIMKSIQPPSDTSYQRLQRRILIKILEAQLHHKQTTFNWVMGGHSAAAGHGNLFNQTYGFIIEESLRPVFQALDITFYGKNYAMGSLKSAPEGALCMSSLYGVDLDILSWDFGMTDGSRSSDLYNMWSQKAGIHPTMPTLVSYGSTAAKTIHAQLEKDGMSAFEALFVEEKRAESLPRLLPDSDGEDVDVESLPKGVKFYKCNGHIESGDLCGATSVKFDTKKACKSISYQVKWHNGWKDHLLKGRVSAAFIIEQVLEALSTLESGSHEEVVSSTTPQISQAYLDHLKEQEEQDKALFLSSKVPRVYHFEGELEEHHDSFLRSKSVCRYGYLPSYARFEGLVTEKRQESLSYVGGGRTTFVDEGEDFMAPTAPTPDNDSPPRLVYNYRSDRGVCPAAEIDFKDYFSIRNEDKTVVTVVPNDAENEAFSVNEDWKEREGLVTVCEIFYAQKRPPVNRVSVESMFNSTETTMTINDVPVTNCTRIGTIDSYCFVLRHAEGYKFPSSDKHGLGRYEIKMEVPERGGQLYLSSFIVV